MECQIRNPSSRPESWLSRVLLTIPHHLMAHTWCPILQAVQTPSLLMRKKVQCSAGGLCWEWGTVVGGVCWREVCPLWSMAVQASFVCSTDWSTDQPATAKDLFTTGKRLVYHDPLLGGGITTSSGTGGTRDLVEVSHQIECRRRSYHRRSGNASRFSELFHNSLPQTCLH